MKEMISAHNCLSCDAEINSESETVFCNTECLETYIEDLRDLETHLYKMRNRKQNAR